MWLLMYIIAHDNDVQINSIIIEKIFNIMSHEIWRMCNAGTNAQFIVYSSTFRIVFKKKR